ncbi:alpha-rhamnosidase [Clostridia bacterium]|nr:alpha-rhamnosidase [Clostridia bacterium]
MNFKRSEWIWISDGSAGDEYGEFFDALDYATGDAVIGISCESNYALYINGELAGFGQYADFPWYKVYDEIEITGYLRQGKNELRIVVWHYGGDGSFVSYAAEPCLIYEAQIDGKPVVCSSGKTLCRRAEGYVSNLKKRITRQIGYSFRYDMGRRGGTLRPAFVNNAINYSLFQRPIKRLTLENLKSGKLIDQEKRIYDLGNECAGFLYIRFKATVGQLVTISYGEHIADGEVRRRIGSRDFSVEVIGSGNTEEYLNPFRRLGCRYLQVEADENAVVEEIGLRETFYPVTEKPYKADNELRRRIYGIAVRTLRLCMHEHYEDTPWREQALYALDGRNQMLFGSAAFEGYEFQRASLKLLSEGKRDDGLLTICSPSSVDIVIPSFSLWYIVAMREYAGYSGDLSLAAEYFNKLTAILKFFTDREEECLVRKFGGPLGSGIYWDFYEWSEGLSGERLKDGLNDAPLQFLYSLALNNMSDLCKLLGKTEQASRYAEQAAGINAAANARFWRRERGLYDTFGDGTHYSELVNALAVLSGAAVSERADKICAALTSDRMIKSTISMKCFTYDALIKTDKKKYREYILQDIDARYKLMSDAGATSFWETEKGEKAFDNAGSLCHGWSAAPVYYYRLLSEGV